MIIEITVVTTEILNGKVKPETVEEIKDEMIREFGRLYILPNRIGFWYDKDGKLYEDTSEVWRIITDKPDAEEKIKVYADKIKIATKQLAQLYTINKEAKAIFLHGQLFTVDEGVEPKFV
jgi:hypothetical protein